MAVPLQHVSQYIPTNFGQISQLANLYNQDLAQRNQLYDKAQALKSGYLAQLAQAKTSDITTRNKLIQDLQDRIDSAVSKKGGDYAAAAKDITDLVAAEKTNPWYQYDTDRLASLQQEAKLKQAWGPDYFPGRDYSKITLDDYIADPTIFKSTSLNLSPYRLAMAKLGKSAAALKTKDIDYIDPMDPFTRVVGTRTGYNTPELQSSFMASQGNKMIEDFMRERGLEGEEIKNALTDELIANIGGKEHINRIANRTAIASSKGGSGTPSTRVPLPIFNDLISVKDKENKHKEASPRLTSKFGEKIGMTTPNTEGYLGLADKSEGYTDDINKYTANYVENKIIANTPELQRLERDIIDDKSMKIIPSKYRQDVKDNIHEWLNYSKKIVEGDNKKRQTVESVLYKQIDDFLKEKYPDKMPFKTGIGLSDHNPIARYILTAYNNSNKKYKSILEDKVEDYYNQGGHKNSMLLQFSTIDNFNSDERQRLQRLNEINEDSVLPYMFKFVEGDLKGKSEKKVQKAYEDPDSEIKYPQILGVGGNEETGILFAVKSPDNEVAIAKLNTSPEYVYNIANQLNRPDLVSKDLIFKNKDNFKVGEPIPLPNNNIKYYYDPSLGHSGYISKGGKRLFIDNSDIKALNSKLSENNLPTLPIDTLAKDSDIYYFSNKQDLINTVNIINNAQ